MNSDAQLTFYSMHNLMQLSQDIAQPVKAVMSFCPDRLISSPMQISVGKRRVLQCLEVGDTVSLQKELPLSDGAVHMVRFNETICAADYQTYKLVSTTTGETFPLFPYDRNAMRPLIVVIQEGEFLLVTATPQQMGLGIFVSSRGDAIRGGCAMLNNGKTLNVRKGTLQWPAVPKSVGFQFPYVVALLKNNTIEVHNIFDQQLVQSITLLPSQESKCLTEASFALELSAQAIKDAAEAHDEDSPSDKPSTINLVIALKDGVLGLKMAPLESQVDRLLNHRRVDEAVKLAEQMLQWDRSESPEKQRRKAASIYQRAGFVYFCDTLFEDALSYFKKGLLDPRVFISLFPDLVSSRTNRDASPTLGAPPSRETTSTMNWVAELGTIDDIVRKNLEQNYPDVDEETRDSFSKALVANAKDILVKYLTFARANKIGVGRLEEIDTALLKIYAETDSQAMYQLLASEHYCLLEECEPFLVEKKRYYALSLLYKRNNLTRKVLETWIRIASHEFEDPDFEGLPLIVSFLSNVEDKELVWRYAEWVLKQDPVIGSQIFTTHVRKSTLFTPDDVLDYLKPYGMQATRLYLEYLVNEPTHQEEKWHTALALMYVDKVLDVGNESTLQATENDFSNLPTRQSFRSFVASRSDALSRARARLITFLEQSDLFQIPLVLNKIQAHRRYHLEHAVLYAKMGEHEKVLRTLVYDVKDFCGAELYCKSKLHQPPPLQSHTTTAPTNDTKNVTGATGAIQEKKMPATRQSLLFLLLQLYLKSEMRDTYANEVLHLLNIHAADLDVMQ
ncbi:transforming growth factor, beta receptor associated protein 1, partial [Quaeritorhiza haematococci]